MERQQVDPFKKFSRLICVKEKIKKFANSRITDIQVNYGYKTAAY